MKSAIFLLILIIPSVAFIIIAGFYPVAMIDNHPVLMRDWEELQASEQRFINMRVKNAKGGADESFLLSQNEREAYIKRRTLTKLIEDDIIFEEGKVRTSEFQLLIREYFDRRSNEDKVNDIEAEKNYGLTKEEYRTRYLLPQAWREILKADILEPRGEDFDDWLDAAKRKHAVRLIFGSFVWNGREVR